MKLYELPEKMADLMDRYVDPETGEIMDEEKFDKEIAHLEMQADDVYEYIALQIKNEIAEAEAIKSEIETLTKRMKSKQNAAQRKKDYMSKYFQRDKFETPRVKISWSKSSKVWIDPQLDPKGYYADLLERMVNGETKLEADDFIRIKEVYEWDKVSIKELISKDRLDGEAQFFKIEESKSIRIK